MHDMPVHPGLEIDDYAITCERSLVLRQAQNRMYSGQALLLYLLDAL
jgi:ornithine carbamoyltransferase